MKKIKKLCLSEVYVYDVSVVGSLRVLVWGYLPLFIYECGGCLCPYLSFPYMRGGWWMYM